MDVKRKHRSCAFIFAFSPCFAFPRKVARVNALTGRHAFYRYVTPRVAGSVFKARMKRNVMLEITGKQSEVVFKIITETNRRKSSNSF